jgi:hypothetical protein
MKRLFCTDLDGTLLNSAHETDARILEGMARIEAAGGYVVPCTGRAKSMTRNFQFPSEYMICFNGAAILHQGKPIESYAIPAESIQELLEAFPQTGFEFFTDEDMLCLKDREAVLTSYQNRWKKRGLMRDIANFDRMFPNCRFDVSIEELLSKPILKINVSRDADTEGLDQWLEHHPELVNAPSDHVLFEITNAQADKAKAVARLAEILHIDHEDIAVFGDGINDLNMLKAFESWAPDTGQSAAKEAASHIIPGGEHCVIETIESLYFE